MEKLLFRRRVLWVLTALFSTVFLLFVVFFLAILQVSSRSMEDTLNDHDFILVLRTNFLVTHHLLNQLSVRRGEIIVLNAPYDPSVILVKRVIALGGDKVRILDGKVMINGVVQTEGYLTRSHGNATSASWPSDFGAEGQRDITVPPEHYFVLGDNRDSSSDSRHWGSVRAKDVIGKLLFTIKH